MRSLSTKAASRSSRRSLVVVALVGVVLGICAAAHQVRDACGGDHRRRSRARRGDVHPIWLRQLPRGQERPHRDRQRSARRSTGSPLRVIIGRPPRQQSAEHGALDPRSAAGLARHRHARPQRRPGRRARHHRLPLHPALARAAQHRRLDLLHLTPLGRPHADDVGAAALAPALPDAVDAPRARHRTVVPDKPADHVRNQMPSPETNRTEHVTICPRRRVLPNPSARTQFSRSPIHNVRGVARSIEPSPLIPAMTSASIRFSPRATSCNPARQRPRRRTHRRWSRAFSTRVLRSSSNWAPTRRRTICAPFRLARHPRGQGRREIGRLRGPQAVEEGSGAARFHPRMGPGSRRR